MIGVRYFPTLFAVFISVMPVVNTIDVMKAEELIDGRLTGYCIEMLEEGVYLLPPSLCGLELD